MFEKETWPGADFAECRLNLEAYTQAIQQVAEKRRLYFVPEFVQAFSPATPLTNNGMHLTGMHVEGHFVEGNYARKALGGV